MIWCLKIRLFWTIVHRFFEQFLSAEWKCNFLGGVKDEICIRGIAHMVVSHRNVCCRKNMRNTVDVKERKGWHAEGSRLFRGGLGMAKWCVAGCLQVAEEDDFLSKGGPMSGPWWRDYLRWKIGWITGMTYMVGRERSSAFTRYHGR